MMSAVLANHYSDVFYYEVLHLYTPKNAMTANCFLS